MIDEWSHNRFVGDEESIITEIDLVVSCVNRFVIRVRRKWKDDARREVVRRASFVQNSNRMSRDSFMISSSQLPSLKSARSIVADIAEIGHVGNILPTSRDANGTRKCRIYSFIESVPSCGVNSQQAAYARTVTRYISQHSSYLYYMQA